MTHTISPSQLAVGNDRRIYHGINKIRDAINAQTGGRSSYGILDNDYKMAFDFTPYTDYKTCEDETPSTEDNKILAVSLANRFKIEQFEEWMKNGKDVDMFNNFIFELTDGDEKPDAEKFEALPDHTEIEFENDVLKGSDLLTVSGKTVNEFKKDASSLGSFKLQGGWYKAKCLQSINLGSKTTDYHKRWTKALDFFFPDQYGFPPTRIYFYGESFLFLMLASCNFADDYWRLI